jgi:hypothetical protein
MTMGLLGVVMAGIGSALVSATQHETALNREFQAQESVRLALGGLRSDLHCGSTVTPSSGTTALITINLPTGCPTGVGSFTWCTVAAGVGFDLWRVPGPACATTAVGSRRWAQGLLARYPFTPDATVHAGAPVLPDVAVDFAVAAGARSYRLTDRIYLRNGTRQ